MPTSSTSARPVKASPASVASKKSSHSTSSHPVGDRATDLEATNKTTSVQSSKQQKSQEGPRKQRPARKTPTTTSVAALNPQPMKLSLESLQQSKQRQAQQPQQHRHQHSKSCQHIQTNCANQHQHLHKASKAGSLVAQLSALPPLDQNHSDQEEDRNEAQLLSPTFGKQTLSLSGHLVSTTCLSLDSLNNMASSANSLMASKPGNQQQQSSYSVGGSKFAANLHQAARGVQPVQMFTKTSQMSLQNPPASLNGSKIHLSQPSDQTMISNLKRTQQSAPTSGLSIQKSVSLRHIKSLIILLIAIDLLITIFVHHFAVQDQVNLWPFASFKMRFSMLNLILSTIWFILLVGATIFEIYFILLLSSVINSLSFVLLLGFSIVHFSRKIDYNQVNLGSLLALLFSIVLLHLYLLALSGLTIYFTMAVRRRQKI